MCGLFRDVLFFVLFKDKKDADNTRLYPTGRRVRGVGGGGRGCGCGGAWGRWGGIGGGGGRGGGKIREVGGSEKEN